MFGIHSDVISLSVARARFLLFTHTNNIMCTQSRPQKYRCTPPIHKNTITSRTDSEKHEPKIVVFYTEIKSDVDNDKKKKIEKNT